MNAYPLSTDLCDVSCPALNATSVSTQSYSDVKGIRRTCVPNSGPRSGSHENLKRKCGWWVRNQFGPNILIDDNMLENVCILRHQQPPDKPDMQQIDPYTADATPMTLMRRRFRDPLIIWQIPCH